VAFQSTEPVNLISEARRYLRLFSQVRSQPLSNLLRDGPVGCVVDIDAAAHNGTFVPVKTSINPAHTTEDLPPCSTTATQLRIGDRRLWLSARAPVLEQRVLQQRPLAIRDVRRSLLTAGDGLAYSQTRLATEPFCSQHVQSSRLGTTIWNHLVCRRFNSVAGCIATSRPRPTPLARCREPSRPSIF
jgi:hypothetical protein